MNNDELARWERFRQAAWDREQGDCWICEQPVSYADMELDGGWDGDLLFPKHPTCRRTSSGGSARSKKQPYVRLFEAARLFGLSSDLLRDWAASRKLILYRNGNYGHYWVKLSEVGNILSEMVGAKAS